ELCRALAGRRLLAADPREPERVRQDVAARAAVDPDHDVLEHGQRREEREVLERPPDAERRDAMGRQPEDRAAVEADVASRGRVCASSPRSQRYSFSPMCLPTQRPSTKNVSLRRLTYRSAHSLTGSTRVSRRTSRSARRQTVRAWWRNALMRPPPGSVNDLSGSRSFWQWSMRRSSAVTCASPTLNIPSYSASGGVASSLPRSNS